MKGRIAAVCALAALLVAAASLLAVELTRGALDFGSGKVADPCEPREPFPGEGFDPTVQRIVLSSMDGAACELGTTREEFLLSFVPEAGVEGIEWDEPTKERAFRSALLRSVDDAERRGDINRIEAALLTEAVARLPVQDLLNGALNLKDEAIETLGGEGLDADPCVPREGPAGDGVGPAIERIVQNGLDGAACELGITRRQLLTSLTPGEQEGEPDWDPATVERVVRASLVRAIDDAEDRGGLPRLPAIVLRELAERLPIEALLDGGKRLRDAVEGLF